MRMLVCLLGCFRHPVAGGGSEEPSSMEEELFPKASSLAAKFEQSSSPSGSNCSPTNNPFRKTGDYSLREYSRLS